MAYEKRIRHTCSWSLKYRHLYLVYKSLVKRALASSVTVVMFLGSIQYLPIGIVNSLYNTSPIMTFFIEVFYYKKVNDISSLEPNKNNQFDSYSN